MAQRSKALARLAGRGGMASVALTAVETEGLLGRWEGRVTIAAYNGPTSQVVSGDTTAIEELLDDCARREVRARRIEVDYASHCAQVEAVEDDIHAALATITPQTPSIPLLSTLTGEWVSGAVMGAGYWYDNLRQPVRFGAALDVLAAEGYRACVEVSPHPVLVHTLDSAAEEGRLTAIGTLRRDESGPDRFVTSLAQAHCLGLPVDWHRLFEERDAGRVELPTYPFERRPYWLEATPPSGDVAAAGLETVGHPLLGAVVELADEDGYVFTGRLSLATHPWLADHAVMDTVLLPGTAFVDLALHAGARVGLPHLEELTLLAPLVLPEQGGVQLQLALGSTGQDEGRRSVAVHARRYAVHDDGAEVSEPWTCHATGTLAAPPVAAEAGAPADRVPSGDWPPQGAEPVSVTDLYEHLAENGYQYGPAFRGLTAAWRCGDEGFAEVVLPEGTARPADHHALHPALLDAALHAIPLTAAPAGAQPVDHNRLPFAWRHIDLRATGATAVRVRLTRTAEDTVSIALADPDGNPVAGVEALVTRPFTAGQLAAAAPAADGSHLYRLVWEAASSAERPGAGRGSWAVIGDDPLGLASALTGAGCPVAAHGDLSALIAALDAGEAAPGAAVVTVDEWQPAEGPADEPVAPAQRTARQVRQVARRLLELVQMLLAEPRLADTRLAVVTRRAVATGPDDAAPDLVHAPVWGLVRSAQAEHPGRFRLVDHDGHPGTEAARLTAALASDAPQLALRGNALLVPRLDRAPSAPPALCPPSGVAAWRLESTERGTLDRLALVACPEADGPLAEGQVRVAVRAAGMNFRDVLNALGMLPGAGPIGVEGAGEVVEVGPGVAELVPGDRVMGLLPGAFGPLAITDHRSVVRIPREWTYQQAATVPAVFLTAYYALSDLAGVGAGRSVLVHAAAGGVGMAAVQLARHWGAEVFGTAGEGKWDTLRAMGLDERHIASSRSLDFRETFLAATEGRGVDVVLNALTGEFVDASLDLLPRGGHFLEMGRTDPREAAEVATAHAGVVYRAFDVNEAGLDRLREILGEVVSLFESGALTPLPVTTWDVRDAVRAFRFMSQARHVGKVVLTMPPPAPFGDPAGTVLITGGTGVLGARVAAHLAGQGARHLLLVSRRGPQAPGADELRDRLTGLGAEVTVAACDMADHQAVAALLDTLPADRPLTAVVHAAGTLDDAVLTGLTPERLESVLGAKVDAALHLHHLTQRFPLARFTLFSSSSGVLGAPGQANYAAANSFLDALAHHRNAEGRPAVSLAWGMWAATSGMTGTLGAADRRRIQRSGVSPLTDEQALALLDTAHTRIGEPLLVPVRLDRGALRQRAAEGTLHPLLDRLAGAPRRAAKATGAVAADAGALLAQLTALDPPQRHQRLLSLVRGHAAATLGHASPEAIGADQSFMEAGFDSLTAVELRNRLTAATALRLPGTLLFDHPTPTVLARHLESSLAIPAQRDGSPLEGGAADGAERPARAAAQAPAPEVPAVEAPHSLASLFRRAYEINQLPRGMQLMRAASYFREGFTSVDGMGPAPDPLRLAHGAVDPVVLCLPTVAAVASPNQYARFAAHFRGARDVWFLPLPGFAGAERPAASLEALLEFEARQALSCAGGAPFVLLGHSGGGWVAHALAAHLERAGTPASAVVLVDVYLYGDEAVVPLERQMTAGMFDMEERFGLRMDDARLTAMGCYLRMFSNYTPEKVATPTLFVRGTDHVSAELAKTLGDGDFRPSWHLPHTALDVAGDHFTIMQEHAAATAEAVDCWLTATF
ncbi:hypothetical protein ACZ90_62420 [Streptomyces albus subsp. albus]|nr:hypothetical protein ACZ90_62420 [Streptomyces albus subsp. albus]